MHTYLRVLFLHIFMLCSLICYPQRDSLRITKIDVYAHSFRPHVALSVTADDILSFDLFKGDTNDPIIISSFRSYMSYMSKQKVKRKMNKLKYIGDYRIAAVINYEDGTTDLIAAGDAPRVLYKWNMFEDKEYVFLLLMNSQFDLPDLKKFLQDNKLLE